jgi:hypothetical protein
MSEGYNGTRCLNVTGRLLERFKMGKKELDTTSLFLHRINFWYLRITLHNTCIVFFQIKLRQQLARPLGAPSQLMGSGAGRQ